MNAGVNRRRNELETDWSHLITTNSTTNALQVSFTEPTNQRGWL